MNDVFDGLTILKGCFNCKKYKGCRSERDKEKGINPKEIHHGKNNKPYRAGCNCADYDQDKEVVQFT
jgi:hypothetical protein